MPKKHDVLSREKKVKNAKHKNRGSKIFLSVVIPAYNEEKRIVKTLESIDRYLEKQPYSYEIIVVANNSTDRTDQVVREYQSSVEHLRLYDLQIAKPGGAKGYAVQKGMEKARGEYRIFMDADNATKIDEVKKFWKLFESGYDVVVGSRHTKGSTITVHQPLYRRLLGRLGNMLIRVVLIRGIHDTQCGFKAFTKKASEKIFPKITMGGWSFDIEVLALANLYGFKIAEAPVIWRDFGDSRVKAQAYKNTLKDLFAIRKKVRSGYYDDKK